MARVGILTFLTSMIQLALGFVIKSLYFNLDSAGNLIFSVFNILVANILFTVVADKTAQTCIDDEGLWGLVVYAVFMLPKYLKSIYYSVPSEKRYGGTSTARAWSALFWGAFAFEIVVGLISLCVVLARAQDIAQSEKDVTRLQDAAVRDDDLLQRARSTTTILNVARSQAIAEAEKEAQLQAGRLQAIKGMSDRLPTIAGEKSVQVQADRLQAIAEADAAARLQADRLERLSLKRTEPLSENQGDNSEENQR